ncbi:MAG: O-antigen ligase family protein [Leptolyngbyaceae cyanobacterium MAG.088]|nr:O-antigen ligase family protein [Leptolyngbyaceae cyanobacterium MAG.088]
MSVNLECQESKSQQIKQVSSSFTKKIIFLEYFFTIIALFLYSSEMIKLLITGGASEGDGTNMYAFDYSLSSQLYLIIYLFTAILAVLRWKKILFTLLINKQFLVFLVLIPFSTLWSLAPTETVNGTIAILATSLMGVYLASRYTLREQLRLFGITFALVLIFSWFFILFFPHYGIMAAVHSGAWRGIFIHKNNFGQTMVVASTVFLVLANTQKPRWLYWLGFGLTLISIILSASSGALINFTIVTSLLIGSRFFCLPKKRFILFLVAFILISCSLSLWLPEIFATTLGAVGKDTTLTGRTDLWPYAIDKIVERPWLGYGYNGFWNGLDGESAYIIRAVRWAAPNAHNGFLDLWLQLGFIGLFIFVAILWETFFKAVLLMRITQSWEQTWILVFLVFLIISNLTESLLMSRNHFSSIVLISIVFSESLILSRLLKYRRQSRLVQK